MGCCKNKIDETDRESSPASDPPVSTLASDKSSPKFTKGKGEPSALKSGCCGTKT